VIAARCHSPSASGSGQRSSLKGLVAVSRILLCQTPDTQLPELEQALTKKEYQVAGVLDWTDLGRLDAVREFGPIDLAIIDASCGLDGASCCKAFNKAYPSIAIILLIAEGVRADPECRKLTGGNVLRMPFTPRKVINRIKKMASCRLGSTITVGGLSLNLDRRCVYRGEVVHRLTPRQARLLEVFMRHAGRTLTRKFLMETVWETDYMGDTRTLDVHVRWLRERIEEDPSSPRYLRTVRGIGYRFGVPSEEESAS
jgi:DNA-binding response OmpR family regulator